MIENLYNIASSQLKLDKRNFYSMFHTIYLIGKIMFKQISFLAIPTFICCCMWLFGPLYLPQKVRHRKI